MLKRIHEKTNALQEIRRLTEEVSNKLSELENENVYEQILALLEQRKAKMAQIDLLDRQLSMLTAAGYPMPSEEDIRQIGLEKQAIYALLKMIKETDEKNNRLIQEARAQLMEALKDVHEVREGNKKAFAYTPGGSAEERGARIDTLR
jgi:flagellar biosynthesis/type III secretory pathway chaperone